MLHIKQEQDVSLGLWKAWLYKQLLYRLDSSLGFGIAELGCGASTQRAEQTEHIAFYVLSGQGTFDCAGTHQAFKVGQQFKMLPDIDYFFDCNCPTRLLACRAQTTLGLALTPQELKPMQLIQGSGQCHYVVSGQVKLMTQDTPHVLPAGTAFYIESNLGYTLQNVGNTNALILTVSGEAQPVGHGQQLAHK